MRRGKKSGVIESGGYCRTDCLGHPESTLDGLELFHRESSISVEACLFSFHKRLRHLRGYSHVPSASRSSELLDLLKTMLSSPTSQASTPTLNKRSRVTPSPSNLRHQLRSSRNLPGNRMGNPKPLSTPPDAIRSARRITSSYPSSS